MLQNDLLLSRQKMIKIVSIFLLACFQFHSGIYLFNFMILFSLHLVIPLFEFLILIINYYFFLFACSFPSTFFHSYINFHSVHFNSTFNSNQLYFYKVSLFLTFLKVKIYIHFGNLLMIINFAFFLKRRS